MKCFYFSGEHSKITLKTKNIFIEATATDLTKAEIVLDTIVAMFSQYSKNKFVVEPVKVVYEDGSTPTTVYPKLEYREQTVNITRMNTKIGVEVEKKNVSKLLAKMGLAGKDSGKENKDSVTVSYFIGVYFGF